VPSVAGLAVKMFPPNLTARSDIFSDRCKSGNERQGQQWLCI
jgi:hypothetical protein